MFYVVFGRIRGRFSLEITRFFYVKMACGYWIAFDRVVDFRVEYLVIRYCFMYYVFKISF